MRQNPNLFGFDTPDQLTAALGRHLPDHGVDPQWDLVMAARTVTGDRQTLILAFWRGPQLTMILDRSHLWEANGIDWDEQPTTRTDLLLTLCTELSHENQARAMAFITDVQSVLDDAAANPDEAALLGFDSADDVWAFVDLGVPTNTLTLRAAYRRYGKFSDRCTVILVAQRGGVLLSGVTRGSVPSGLHGPRTLNVTLCETEFDPRDPQSVHRLFAALLDEHEPREIAERAQRQYRAETGLEPDVRYQGYVRRFSDLRRLLMDVCVSDDEVLYATRGERGLRLLLRQSGELRRLDASETTLDQMAQDGFSHLYPERTTLRAFAADLSDREQPLLLDAVHGALLSPCA
ncbi:hypothetical protein [Deinococcus soli (ex Cha et al. 2016)]|uniref:Nucleotide-binding universal stress UspA family protein n=2 Tax=Deinococcus soli (ex Cha et al. 2016) TaxID=1309411 RepID=A0ACC6KGX4_9DEIO|nr:hypothetical protein [Deinococcus soli (ex Cha et al. 2016)]MDR6218898.1 nucleotide-binding universal stress UspA family protein [Deinococcus soli (ex Cha et al. 2016)]MDR6328695.1 nucleotide-binding universal stress UspA family protein [Deinococcus soli (ex Cha et al. 2016)]MDR6751818.1 nucleotide-binding universal stress UspA family protein [Deinococcus soli (ex Cha et al. 2016)]